jgi:DNA-binding PadR family transcriptional regulator
LEDLEPPATLNELAVPFEISVQGVSQHLKVLEHAGLVTRRRVAQTAPRAFLLVAATGLTRSSRSGGVGTNQRVGDDERQAPPTSCAGIWCGCSMRQQCGYQLRVVQEVVLALLANEPAHGYQLRARLQLALGPLAGTLNGGHVYVTLNRLEKAGLVSAERIGQADRPDRKVYDLTVAGRERVADWLRDTSWPKPAPAEFHLKLVAAAAAGLGDPAAIVNLQRRELLGGLADAQRAALAQPDGSVAGLLLEGVVLRLQADLRWLDVCADFWESAR